MRHSSEKLQHVEVSCFLSDVIVVAMDMHAQRLPRRRHSLKKLPHVEISCFRSGVLVVAMDVHAQRLPRRRHSHAEVAGIAVGDHMLGLYTGKRSIFKKKKIYLNYQLKFAFYYFNYFAFFMYIIHNDYILNLDFCVII